MQRNIIRDPSLSLPLSCRLTFTSSFSPAPNLLSDPWPQVEITSTSKDAAPQNKLSSIDDHAQDIELWLEDFFVSMEMKLGRQYSQTETSEKTSPAASIATKMNEMPRTVRWM